VQLIYKLLLFPNFLPKNLGAAYTCENTVITVELLFYKYEVHSKNMFVLLAVVKAFHQKQANMNTIVSSSLHIYSLLNISAIKTLK
jgi:hypothetical protein